MLILLVCVLSLSLHGASSIVFQIPARATCSNKHSYLSKEAGINGSTSCVAISRRISRIPTFAPCEEGTHLEGRNCIGRITTPRELACPMNYHLNDLEVCTKVEAYLPPTRVCPEGFIPHGRGTSRGTCVKTEIVPPLLQSPQSWQFSPRELICPEGFVMKQKGRTSKTRKEMKEFQTTKVCWRQIVIPVQSDHRCKGTDYFIDNLDACLNVKVAIPEMQCPHPEGTPRLGFGDARGIYRTPEFIWNSVAGMCVAHEAPALYPQCPPGWALEGLWTPICHKKIYTPVIYDCLNAEGFELRKSEKTGQPVCELKFNMTNYTAMPNYLTKRMKKDQVYLKITQTPWSALSAAERAYKNLRPITAWDSENSEENNVAGAETARDSRQRSSEAYDSEAVLKEQSRDDAKSQYGNADLTNWDQTQALNAAVNALLGTAPGPTQRPEQMGASIFEEVTLDKLIEESKHSFFEARDSGNSVESASTINDELAANKFSRRSGSPEAAQLDAKKMINPRTSFTMAPSGSRFGSRNIFGFTVGGTVL